MTPDFLIIGAPRCGTSQFYASLCRHPRIVRAARKELHYFDWHYDKGPGWYASLFPSVPEGSITGEATPRYLAHPKGAGRVARDLPDVKLIVLLRDPVDRAYSHYHLLRRRGLRQSFEEVIDKEEAWLAENTLEGVAPTNLLITGMYVEHLKRWHTYFPVEQILVLHSADFFRRMRKTLKVAHEFLGLPPHQTTLRTRQSVPHYEPMRPETKEQLERFFAPHNERLYEYLGRDFGWRRSRSGAG